MMCNIDKIVEPCNGTGSSSSPNDNDVAIVCGCPKLRAGIVSNKSIQQFDKNSKLSRFDDQISDIPWSAIRKMGLLGKGGFSEVHKVQLYQNTNKYYAIKHLKSTIINPTQGRNATDLVDPLKNGQKKAAATETLTADYDFDTAAIDLVVEGELLSRLRHENIIQLYGIYDGEVETAYTNPNNHDIEQQGYFLLLDLLEQETVATRLRKLRRTSQKKRRTKKALLYSNMISMIEHVALGVAKGLEYLHSNNVILRDLKPDNIGFNEQDTPIIFDLGFARELHTIDQLELCGSMRYMSPEMAGFGNSTSTSSSRHGGAHGSSHGEQGSPRSQGGSSDGDGEGPGVVGITLASDVYSFGVLLYELVTLEKPFKKYSNSRQEFTEGVFLQGYRPRVSSIPSKTIRELITKCWDTNPQQRPSMKTVVTVLRVEVAAASVRTNSKNGGAATQIEDDLLPNGYNVTIEAKSTNTSSLSLRGFGSVTSLVDSITSLSLRDFPKSARNSSSSTSSLSTTTSSIPARRRSVSAAGGGNTISSFRSMKSFANKTCTMMRRRSSEKNFVLNQQQHHPKESAPHGQEQHQEEEEAEEEKTIGSDSNSGGTSSTMTTQKKCAPRSSLFHPSCCVNKMNNNTTGNNNERLKRRSSLSSLYSFGSRETLGSGCSQNSLHNIEEDLLSSMTTHQGVSYLRPTPIYATTTVDIDINRDEAEVVSSTNISNNNNNTNIPNRQQDSSSFMSHLSIPSSSQSWFIGDDSVATSTSSCSDDHDGTMNTNRNRNTNKNRNMGTFKSDNLT